MEDFNPDDEPKEPKAEEEEEGDRVGQRQIYLYFSNISTYLYSHLTHKVYSVRYPLVSNSDCFVLF